MDKSVCCDHRDTLSLCCPPSRPLRLCGSPGLPAPSCASRRPSKEEDAGSDADKKEFPPLAGSSLWPRLAPRRTFACPVCAAAPQTPPA
ncbi:hypothetical protein GN956_G1913 [Arapaima gigas]